MLFVWIAALVFFVIVELVTPQLVSIWFALGSLVALICNLLHTQIWIQGLVFVVVSAVMLIITRPLYNKYFKAKHIKTNTDRLIGTEGIVIEEIDNINGTGQVKVSGQVWSAKAQDNAVICTDTYVSIVKIEGVKLIVKRK